MSSCILATGNLLQPMSWKEFFCDSLDRVKSVWHTQTPLLKELTAAQGGISKLNGLAPSIFKSGEYYALKDEFEVVFNNLPVKALGEAILEILKEGDAKSISRMLELTSLKNFQKLLKEENSGIKEVVALAERLTDLAKKANFPVKTAFKTQNYFFSSLDTMVNILDNFLYCFLMSFGILHMEERPRHQWEAQQVIRGLLTVYGPCHFFMRTLHSLVHISG